MVQKYSQKADVQSFSTLVYFSTNQTTVMIAANPKIKCYHMTAREFKGSPFIVEDVAVCKSLKINYEKNVFFSKILSNA